MISFGSYNALVNIHQSDDEDKDDAITISIAEGVEAKSKQYLAPG